MSVYERDPHMAPDSDFEPGALCHLVPGNAGRLLDARRTPVSVVSVDEESGMIQVRIEKFEDAGAFWEIPFERVSIFQFAQGCTHATDAVVQRLQRIASRLDRPIEIRCDADAARATQARRAQAHDDAMAWLASESTFFRSRSPVLPDIATRRGDPRLFDDLRAYMEMWELASMEEAFATQFVSNPGSGELVKGHRIVMAELGVVAYTGNIVRRTSLFDGAWSKSTRAEHIVRRLAFVSAMFTKVGRSSLRLYRGISSPEPLKQPENRTFVSATFSEDVANSHFNLDEEAHVSVLYRQLVPIHRVFMTFWETEAMNRMFLEAEAVLLYDPDSYSF